METKNISLIKDKENNTVKVTAYYGISSTLFLDDESDVFLFEIIDKLLKENKRLNKIKNYDKKDWKTIEELEEKLKRRTQEVTRARSITNNKTLAELLKKQNEEQDDSKIQSSKADSYKIREEIRQYIEEEFLEQILI